MTSGQIANKYGCYGSTITRYLRNWNVKMRNPASGEQYNNIYNANIHYFDVIDCAEKAYWLGYIAADGHVSDETALMLGCHYLDVDILEKFKECIESNHPIGVNQDGNTVLNIVSKYLARKLKEYGLFHDKSHSLHLKQLITYVPEECIDSFFTGLFDGDGSIRFYKYDYISSFQYHFGFTGVKESVELFSEHFHMNTKIVDEGNGIYTVRIAGAAHIYWCVHKLYDNCPIHCNRKYYTAQNVLRLVEKEQKNRVKGVMFEKQSGKWLTTISRNNRQIKIGRFDSKIEAETARLQKEFDEYGYKAPQWYYFDKYGIGE